MLLASRFYSHLILGRTILLKSALYCLKCPNMLVTLIPVAARSKAWICGRSLAGISRSNAAGGMDVCLLWVLSVVRLSCLRRADYSSRGVLPTVGASLWYRNLKNEEVVACVGPQCHWKKKVIYTYTNIYVNPLNAELNPIC